MQVCMYIKLMCYLYSQLVVVFHIGHHLRYSCVDSYLCMASYISNYWFCCTMLRSLINEVLMYSISYTNSYSERSVICNYTLFLQLQLLVTLNYTHACSNLIAQCNNRSVAIVYTASQHPVQLIDQLRATRETNEGVASVRDRMRTYTGYSSSNTKLKVFLRKMKKVSNHVTEE